jgi:hypothetical protein
VNHPNKLQWVALEYEEKERTPDWYWALGVIIIAGAIASIIFDNYFFAVLLLVSGGLMTLFTIKKPEMVPYEINKKGIKIKNRIYLFEKIKSFWVQKNPSEEERELHGNLPDEELFPTLFIKTERAFMPIISIPIREEYADNIRNIMLNHDVKEEFMKDYPADKVMDFLGF